MYYSDHPPPHFHATYAGQTVLVDIRTFAVLEGSIPPRQLGKVVEWAALHQLELGRVWDEARAGRVLAKIPPLE